MKPTPVSSIAERVRVVQSDATKAQQFVADDLASVKAREEDLQAWVLIDENAPQTVGPTPAGPLAGVSVGVKDLIDVAGMPTRSGSITTNPENKLSSAPCIEHLESLGATVLGKTTTTEFGFFKPSKTRNPINGKHTPGGSSSGSAAAVGGRTVPLALGTQTAGSVTRPASYCGTAAFVFARQDVNLKGVDGMAKSLDSLGFLAQTTEDLNIAVAAFLNRPLTLTTGDVTVLLWTGSDIAEISPAMTDAVNNAANLLAETGLEHCSFELTDHVATLTQDHPVIMAYEAYEKHGHLLNERPEDLSPQFRELLITGRGLSQEQYDSALSRTQRTDELFRSLLKPGTVIMGPAAQDAAPYGQESTGDPVLSRPWQALGYPVLTVPGARKATGMPLGIQLIGLPGTEAELFTVGQMLEEKLTEQHGGNDSL